ncbi:1-acyl-sn-glycerol-3-phosphate acyltransferase [Micrococcales bacterium 31B]|nr:1-acyl-sn-glycerol-3-phosphate acyltransferase [Micrococcales bacterium 31B]
MPLLQETVRHRVTRAILRHTLGTFIRLVWRPKVRGVENFPADEPVIIASNHLAFVDSFFVPLCAPRRMYFLGKIEYVNSPGLKGWLMKQFFTGVGMIPVDRQSASAARESLDIGKHLLEANLDFGIYPEGTRSPDGRLFRGRTGVARLVMMTGAKVVPCGIIGTDKVQPGGAGRLRYSKVAVNFGEPLDFSEFKGMENHAKSQRIITDRVISEIQKLSGQEYVEVYASTLKSGPAAATGR